MNKFDVKFAPLPVRKNTPPIVYPRGNLKQKIGIYTPPEIRTTPSANLPPTLLAQCDIDGWAAILVAAIRKNLGFDPTQPIRTTTERRLIIVGFEALKPKQAGGDL